MKTILFITDQSQSYYFKSFLEACSRYSLRTYTFDVPSFPERNTFTLELGEFGRLSGIVEVVEARSNGLEHKTLIDINEVDVAWYLRAGRAHSTFAGSIEKRFAESEANSAINSLCACLPCRWINSREGIRRIESNKLYQQMMATRSGLKVPDTIVTNDCAELTKFYPDQKELLLKTLGYAQLDDNNQFGIYSQLFERTGLSSSPAAIRHCPVFAQRYVEKRYEYRVMVIGGEVLACRICSQDSERTRIDWRRYDFENVRHERAVLPDEIAARLLLFMKQVELQYGAIDLIETPSGDFVFLEINPDGQWDWIAQLANLPIAEAVAHMLAVA